MYEYASLTYPGHWPCPQVHRRPPLVTSQPSMSPLRRQRLKESGYLNSSAGIWWEWKFRPTSKLKKGGGRLAPPALHLVLPPVIAMDEMLLGYLVCHGELFQ